MQVIQGKPISPGYARGRGVLFGVGELSAPRRIVAADEVEGEIERFQAAIEDSRRDLLYLQECVQAELGSSEADIFTAHLLFLKDRQVIDRVEGAIRENRLGVEAAIELTVAELVDLLSQSDNAYLRERTEDIRDLGQRLLRHILRGAAGRSVPLEAGTVLVARELLPSDVIEIDRRHLAGIVTERGGETGHAAILARALGIPAVTGVTDATRVAVSGEAVLLNGLTGEVVFDPVPQPGRRFRRAHAALRRGEPPGILGRSARVHDLRRHEDRTVCQHRPAGRGGPDRRSPPRGGGSVSHRVPVPRRSPSAFPRAPDRCLPPDRGGAGRAGARDTHPRPRRRQAAGVSRGAVRGQSQSGHPRAALFPAGHAGSVSHPYALRTSTVSSLEELAAASLACESAEVVSTLVNQALRHALPEFRGTSIAV